jgi:hypothetical protein
MQCLYLTVTSVFCTFVFCTFSSLKWGHLRVPLPLYLNLHTFYPAMGDWVWLSANVLAHFLTHNKIIQLCDRAGFNQNGICIQVAGKPQYWVKYSKNSLIWGEGQTQAYIAGIMNANPVSAVHIPNVYLGFSHGNRGYIVTDFILGARLAQCKLPTGSYYKNDIKAIATAIQQLINIKIPMGTAPSPIGSSLIGHDFFVKSLSLIRYNLVAHLEAQINEVFFLLAFGTLH